MDREEREKVTPVECRIGGLRLGAPLSSEQFLFGHRGGATSRGTHTIVGVLGYGVAHQGPVEVSRLKLKFHIRTT